MLPLMNRSAVARPLVIFLLVCVSSTAWAYRPFDSTDADVAEFGRVEVELGPVGYLWSRETRGLYAPSLILNWGFVPSWELVLQGRNFIVLDGPPGEPSPKLIETGLFAKGVLRQGTLQGGTGLSIATENGVLLPTINDEPGVGLSSGWIFSQRWPAATVHFNAQVELSRAHNLDLFGGLIVEGPYSWTVRPVSEVFVEQEFGASHQLSALVGGIWRLSDALSFDAAVRGARKDGLNVVELRVGLTWGFALFEVHPQ